MKPEIQNHRGIISSSFTTTGWTLCVGAGISLPYFPFWDELAKEFLNRYSKNPVPDAEFELLNEKFGPDAILQGCMNLKNCSKDEFAKDLSEILYKKLLSNLTSAQQTNVKEMFSANLSYSLSPSKVKEFINIRNTVLHKASSNELAKIIAELIDTEKAPNEIISLNAEPLFLKMIESYIYENEISKLPAGTVPEKKIEVITRALSNYKKGQLKYFFLHGYIPIDFNTSTFISSTDKLVFRENEYLDLANNSYSWQSSTFCSIASTRPIVFVGLSLSDANLRKWLTWTQNLRSKEISEATNGKTFTDVTSRHFWIEKSPQDNSMKKVYSSLVYHLGVRIIWINDWNELPSTLNSILDR